MSSPEVTAVIPTYDRPQLLRRAVASAVGQERVALEVIVVDDGSTEPVAPADLPDGVIIARTGGSGGVAAARNLGVERARAPWVAFLDDDDWWAPDHVHRLQSAAERANAGFAYAATWNVDLANSQAVMRPAPPPGGLVSQLLRENAIGTPSCVMIDRSVYLSLGGFDGRLSVVADWDLWIRLAGAAAAAVSPVATVAYAAHDANMSLDLPRLIDEFKRLAACHASLCERDGIRFGEPGFARWMAQLYRRQGRRRAAAAWYVRSARVPGRRLDALRAVGVLLGERTMRIASHGSPPSQAIPPSWLAGGRSGARRAKG
ncbi:MAG TPA: glycosyltransferase family 2 protein [Solirubrobacteraceae bacterium]|jgi:glycosyltransferase involved in cell wall biosynthesis